MRLTTVTRAVGVAAATALLAVGAVAQAQASPSAGYIGDGYANNTHGVWCVQHLVNDVASSKGKGRPLDEDGKWGPNTKSWVKWYQGASGHSLDKDGIVGKGTGGWLLLDGDSYYGGHNYCYTYVPSYF
ncbi:hypothetical protein [Streptomyces sp. AM6-12]|uniref:hypothetical protein n=1 Tax=Streptomyces sp. AM6-12 TaxID=3345149 RepID=UPI00379FC8C3